MNNLKYLIPLIASVILASCGGSEASNTTVVALGAPETPAETTTPAATPAGPATPTDSAKPAETTTPAATPAGPATPTDPAKPAETTTPALTLSFTPTKAFHFTWVKVTGATSYKIKEAITVDSGYSVIGEPTATSFDHIVPLYARLNAKYILESCNVDECTASAVVFTSTKVADMVTSIGYLKASNTDAGDIFGNSVSLSADGNTLAVGAYGEDSISKVINTGQDNGSAKSAGAVYVFTRSGITWSQQAYLKASNTGVGDRFGRSVSLSADGNTLAVGADDEDSNSKVINVGQDNNSAEDAGAVYVFTRSGITWSQQAYLKASNAGGGDSFENGDNFGNRVSLSPDGNTLAVGAWLEESTSTVINTGQDNNDEDAVGAVYVFTSSDAVWTQQAYLKANNAGFADQFGGSVSLSADGNTLAVGASGEESNSTVINTGQDNNDATYAGAVYVFTRSGITWSQQTYLKASNTDRADGFGGSVSLSADGNTLAVGAAGEGSNAAGINGDKGNNDAENAGAAYVFTRNHSAVWSLQAYLKASNTGVGDRFGNRVSLSGDGNTLAVGASWGEDSNAKGVNGDHSNNESPDSGAVYTFARSAATWSQQAYLKASNTGGDDQFGTVALSADGNILAVGASGEASNAKGVNGDQTDNSEENAGAVYVY